MNRWWLVCLALATGCGGGASSTPTAPAVPLVTRIAISGSDLLLIGNSETFTATAESGRLNLPRWESDAPTVATVESLTGRVTAVGTGTATISADANGIRGTKLIRTLPNFAGSWKGRYQEIGCEADGEFVHVRACDSYWDLASGATKMTLTQDGATISGSFALGPYAVSGSVSTDGILTLTGILPGTFTRRLQNVRFESPRNGEMSGSFEELWSSGTTSATGSLRMHAELRGMIRASPE
jgi:Bacterial Ig-like domain (group 2)